MRRGPRDGERIASATRVRSTSVPPLCVVALSIALAACADRAPAPSSARVVVAELRAAGVQPSTALVGVVPDAKDGVSNHNPPGTVEIFSTSDLVLDTAPGNPCGGAAVTAPVVVKSYATEALEDVFVEFTSLIPITHVVCGAQPAPPPEVESANYIGYGSLSGSPASTGLEPGAASTVTWWLDYRDAAPFSFAARVWADVVPAPPTGGTPQSGWFTGDVTLTWTGGAPFAHVEVSATPDFATLVESADVACTGTGPSYACSHTVTSSSLGARHWRAVNRFVQPGGSTLVNGTFSTGGSYWRDAAPASLFTAYIGGGYRLLASSAAPGLDFYSWGWGASPPTVDWTAEAPYFCGAAPDDGNGWFWMDQVYPPSGQTIQWKACTQYGTPGDVATQGACTVGPGITIW